MTNKEFELQRAVLIEGVNEGKLKIKEVNHVVAYLKSVNPCIGCVWNNGFPHVACEECERWENHG